MTQQTRAQWERRHPWNEPYPPWRLATWRERLAVMLIGLVQAAIAAAVAIGLLFLIGQGDELRNRHAAEQQRDHGL